jgi:hypothetical protein
MMPEFDPGRDRSPGEARGGTGERDRREQAARADNAGLEHVHAVARVGLRVRRRGLTCANRQVDAARV